MNLLPNGLIEARHIIDQFGLRIIINGIDNTRPTKKAQFLLEIMDDIELAQWPGNGSWGFNLYDQNGQYVQFLSAHEAVEMGYAHRISLS